MIYRKTASSILSMQVFENGGKDLSYFSDTSSEVEVTRFLMLSDTCPAQLGVETMKCSTVNVSTAHGNAFPSTSNGITQKKKLTG